MPAPADYEHDPYAALRSANFRWFLAGNMLSMFGSQAQSMAIGWEVYERTRSNLAIAMVGLVQVLPVVVFFLPAGAIVDRFDRRRILQCSLVGIAVCSFILAWMSWTGGSLVVTYHCLIALGIVRAFAQPARASLLPHLVPRSRFSNAVTWNSSGFQFTMVAGPALGGLLIYLTQAAVLVYLLNAALALLYFAFLLMIRVRPEHRAKEPFSWRSLAAGLGFVWRTPVIIGAIALDMFAVLLGGAVAMLPVFSKEILDVGPAHLGWMRAAPGVGAVVMSILLAHLPPLRRAGRALLWSVAGFGLATVVFGFSRWFPLSIAMLGLLGALDMISVVIRHTLVQVLTPDEMRGRVSAVNTLFIGLSNELGEFESGYVAYLCQRPGDPTFGPTLSVVSGGIGTLLVVAVVAVFCPQVREYRRLDHPGFKE